jgi:hypothetical protein
MPACKTNAAPSVPTFSSQSTSPGSREACRCPHVRTADCRADAEFAFGEIQTVADAMPNSVVRPVEASSDRRRRPRSGRRQGSRPAGNTVRSSASCRQRNPQRAGSMNPAAGASSPTRRAAASDARAAAAREQ